MPKKIILDDSAAESSDEIEIEEKKSDENDEKDGECDGEDGDEDKECCKSGGTCPCWNCSSCAGCFQPCCDDEVPSSAKRLLVYNLPPKYDLKSLELLFCKYGKIEEINWNKCGYATITFERTRDANRAKYCMNCKKIDGYLLKIKCIDNHSYNTHFCDISDPHLPCARKCCPKPKDTKSSKSKHDSDDSECCDKYDCKESQSSSEKIQESKSKSKEKHKKHHKRSHSKSSKRSHSKKLSKRHKSSAKRTHSPNSARRHSKHSHSRNGKRHHARAHSPNSVHRRSHHSHSRHHSSTKRVHSPKPPKLYHHHRPHTKSTNTIQAYPFQTLSPYIQSSYIQEFDNAVSKSTNTYQEVPQLTDSEKWYSKQLSHLESKATNTYQEIPPPTNSKNWYSENILDIKSTNTDQKFLPKDPSPNSEKSFDEQTTNSQSKGTSTPQKFGQMTQSHNSGNNQNKCNQPTYAYCVNQQPCMPNSPHYVYYYVCPAKSNSKSKLLKYIHRAALGKKFPAGCVKGDKNNKNNKNKNCSLPILRSSLGDIHMDLSTKLTKCESPILNNSLSTSFIPEKNTTKSKKSIEFDNIDRMDEDIIFTSSKLKKMQDFKGDTGDLKKQRKENISARNNFLQILPSTNSGISSSDLSPSNGMALSDSSWPSSTNKSQLSSHIRSLTTQKMPSNLTLQSDKAIYPNVRPYIPKNTPLRSKSLSTQTMRSHVRQQYQKKMAMHHISSPQMFIPQNRPIAYQNGITTNRPPVSQNISLNIRTPSSNRNFPQPIWPSTSQPYNNQRLPAPYFSTPPSLLPSNHLLSPEPRYFPGYPSSYASLTSPMNLSIQNQHQSSSLLSSPIVHTSVDQLPPANSPIKKPADEHLHLGYDKPMNNNEPSSSFPKKSAVETLHQIDEKLLDYHVETPTSPKRAAYSTHVSPSQEISSPHIKTPQIDPRPEIENNVNVNGEAKLVEKADAIKPTRDTLVENVNLIFIEELLKYVSERKTEELESTVDSSSSEEDASFLTSLSSENSVQNESPRPKLFDNSHHSSYPVASPYNPQGQSFPNSKYLPAPWNFYLEAQVIKKKFRITRKNFENMSTDAQRSSGSQYSESSLDLPQLSKSY